MVAGLTGAIPLLGTDVPLLARDQLGVVFGAVATALILFAPSVVCLGAVVPYLVQADTESLASVGRRAGDVSAAATAGSILGSFVTGFFLLPLMPLPVLLGVTAAALLGLAVLAGWILGRGPSKGGAALGAVILVALGAAKARPGEGTLFETQTLYAAVEVTERDGGDGRTIRELWQNGSGSSGEWTDTGFPSHRYAEVSGILLEPVIGDVHSMLVLGGAALSLPVAFQRWQPGLSVDVVEIDPEVTRLAREYFAFGRDAYPGIRVFHEDARVYLGRADQEYDLIYLDVFDNLLSVPWPVVTEEAFTAMAGLLRPGGRVMANIISPAEGPGVAFFQRVQATMGQVFPHVRTYPVSPERPANAMQNHIVMAALDEAAFPETSWPEGDVGPAGRPLTDAWAPVEYLQARLFLGFLTWY